MAFWYVLLLEISTYDGISSILVQISSSLAIRLKSTCRKFLTVVVYLRYGFFRKHVCALQERLMLNLSRTKWDLGRPWRVCFFACYILFIFKALALILANPPSAVQEEPEVLEGKEGDEKGEEKVEEKDNNDDEKEKSEDAEKVEEEEEKEENKGEASQEISKEAEFCICREVSVTLLIRF